MFVLLREVFGETPWGLREQRVDVFLVRVARIVFPVPPGGSLIAVVVVVVVVVVAAAAAASGGTSSTVVTT